jgi:hypothetical protein
MKLEPELHLLKGSRLQKSQPPSRIGDLVDNDPAEEKTLTIMVPGGIMYAVDEKFDIDTPLVPNDRSKVRYALKTMKNPNFSDMQTQSHVHNKR